MAAGVRVGVDVGGTFTDAVVEHEGRLTVWKVPSTTLDQSEGFERAVREALERAGAGAPAVIAHGTTVATNAVLERKGALTGFVATEGFRDLLQIGRQDRPSLYDTWADRPAPVVPRELSVEVPERIGPGGEIVRPLEGGRAAEAVMELAGRGVESVAVCLLFAFANPAHERRVRDLLRKSAPGVRVSLSSEVLPEFREYERASTTALDAYVGPVVERYVARLAGRISGLGAPVVVMRSSGGTMSAERAAREPVHTLLSGPAAGVRGAAALAAASGFPDAVTFDMGGTSTDVCLVEGGEPAVAAESRVGGLPFRTPALAVHTVGAGGGSVLWLDAGGALRAGPRSAGADPGPACYGRGGAEPTVTDAHLALGHLDPEWFLGGRVRLDGAASERALSRLARALGVAGHDVAAAGLAAVRAQMSKAVRVVTVERGRDPRTLALVAFGGAGPMHATALAAELEIGAVLVPPAPGVLSAYGLLVTPLTADASLTRPMTAPDPAEVEAVFVELAARASEALRVQGAEPAALERAVDCRYRGQAHEVPVPGAGLAGLAGRFHAAHLARFGWEAPGEQVELVTFRVRAVGQDPGATLPEVPPGGRAEPAGWVRLWTTDGPVGGPAYRRADLGAGDRVAGPSAVRGEESTLLVDPGWEGEVLPTGLIVLRPA